MISTVVLYMSDSNDLSEVFNSLISASEGTGDAELPLCVMTETSATCDFSGTDISTSLTDACVASKGKVVLHKISICGDGDGLDTGGMAITVDNIPLCMAEICASGVGLMEILSVGLDYLEQTGAVEGGADMISEMFDSCVVIALQNENDTSAAGVASSSVLATVLALGVAFFAF